ncbi:SseB family protein [Plantactinospora veratri]|uniref:SseB family protein n=1 Tax=Plantactinospora veratri TaxID=1436122 RepID=A0ABU7S6X7_9ACTN
MTEWEPATETEAAMRDALRAGDQELYFRILARTDLLLPVSAEALAGRAPMGWGTWTTGGRTHVLAFTSTAALRACLAENAGSTRRAAYPELAAGWPNPEWWLAVNPGLPIEGYLPAWFVSQLSRGDVRLPGRSMGARARLEQVERAARARATAAVPRRPPEGPPHRAEPEPAGAFRPVEPDGMPFRPAGSDGLPLRSPGTARESAEFFRPVDADSPGLPPRSPEAFQEPVEASQEPTESYREPAESYREPAESSWSVESSREPVESFRESIDTYREPVESSWPVEPVREPVEQSRPDETATEAAPTMMPPAGEPAATAPSSDDPTVFPSSPAPAPVPPTGTPATVPVIAPTPARSGLGGEFGSQISEDTSAGWMTPAGPGRPTSASRANGSSGAETPAAPPSSVSAPPSSDAPAAPPPAWHGPVGQQLDRPIEAVETPQERPGGPVAQRTPPPEAPAPQPWTAAPGHAEPSLFTPVSRRPADDAPADPVSASRPATDPVSASWTAADPEATGPETVGAGPTEPIRTGTGLSQSFDGHSFPTGSLTMGSLPTENLTAAPTPSEQFSTGPAGIGEATAGRPAREQFSAGPGVRERFGAASSVTGQFSAGRVAEQFSAGRSARAQYAAGTPVDEQYAGAQVTERFPVGPQVTEQFDSATAATEPISTGMPPTHQTPAGAAPTEPTPAGAAGGRQPDAVPGTSGPAAPEAPAGGVVAEAPGGADPAPARRLPSDFTPANEVEQSLLDAAGDGSTDTFLSTLLLARVLLPVAFNSAPGARPGDDGFEWRTELLDGERYVVVFTSPERLGDHLPETIDTVEVKFARLIRRWPDDNYSFAVNPGTPVGAKLPGGQIVALANWAAEVGLGDDTGEPAPQAPAEEEAPRSTYAPAPEDPGRPTMMQKTIAPSQLSYYLDRGYDRVSGFVHRASEVAHLRTPAKLYAALGLNHPGSPFDRDAEEIYVLRWPAYRPSLYRIPYGGQNEAAMRAMEGWVIERPPFRGNGFAPGESSDVVAEFKVDSVRLPHGAQLHRIGLDGTERLVATLDCDVPVWRRAEED